MANVLSYVFKDTFAIHLFLNNDYSRKNVDLMEIFLPEGAYCLTDANCGLDVSVKKGDVVLDAGAWIGDFAAYASWMGADVHAFEPSSKQFKFLQKTAELNKNGTIYPHKLGLSNTSETVNLAIHDSNSGANSIKNKDSSEINNEKTETIQTTTIDKFVKDSKLNRVDFIKADIEGHERQMLEGARETLKTFAPKLAICAYHLPDDKEVLEKLILDANPEYSVIHLSHKLFAQVPDKK